MGGLFNHVRLAKKIKKKKKKQNKLIGHEYVEIIDEKKVKKDNECKGKKIGDNCKILVRDNGKKETVINEITLQIEEVNVPIDDQVEVKDIYKDG